MGRNRKNHVYNYYEMGETTSKCLTCGKVIKGRHGTNLMTHLKLHTDIYNIVIEKNQGVTEDNTPEASTSSKRPKMNNNVTTVLQEAVNLVTVHGRPFTFIDDQAFQNILSLIPGYSEGCIKSHKVKQSLTEIAAKMRNELGKQVRNKLICLKVDSATLGTRCFLGINLQYILDSNITIQNLGVIELYARHTSDYLAENVILTLQRCQIDIKQIYSCTTDNGANMLKMTKILCDKLKSSYENPIDDDEDTDDSSDDDAEESERYSDIDPEIFQHNLDTALAAHLSEENLHIPTVRCAAHTLQLAIRDTCADNETQNLIKLVRNLVKKLRSPNYAMFLRASSNKSPILDCATRWGSTYDMIERFILLKDILTTDPNNDLYFPSEKWSLLVEFIASLKPSKILTKILQTEQLTMSDFYGHWLRCELETNEINTTLSNKLVKHMRERQQVLFSNEAFISAIYLDPRFNTILTLDQQTSAREHLVKTYCRLVSCQNIDENDLSTASTSAAVPDELNLSNVSSTSNADCDLQSASDKVRDFLATKYAEKHNPNAPSVPSLREKLSDELISFLNEPLLDYKKNIIQYWKTKKTRYPALQELAQIVLSAPATQVSVERLFSSLKFVLSNLRMSLKDDRVEDILFVRNNTQKTENK